MPFLWIGLAVLVVVFLFISLGGENDTPPKEQMIKRYILWALILGGLYGGYTLIQGDIACHKTRDGGLSTVSRC